MHSGQMSDDLPTFPFLSPLSLRKHQCCTFTVLHFYSAALWQCCTLIVPNDDADEPQTPRKSKLEERKVEKEKRKRRRRRSTSSARTGSTVRQHNLPLLADVVFIFYIQLHLSSLHVLLLHVMLSLFSSFQFMNVHVREIISFHVSHII